MIKQPCFHCNYLHITVIISKGAKLIIPSSRRLAAATAAMISAELRPEPPSLRSLPPCRHADFDIAKQSIDPQHRNTSQPDYNESSRSFKMLMANFT